MHKLGVLKYLKISIYTLDLVYYVNQTQVFINKFYMSESGNAGAAAGAAPAAGGEGQAAQATQGAASESQATQAASEASEASEQASGKGEKPAAEKKPEQETEKSVHKHHDRLSKFFGAERKFENDEDYDKGFDEYLKHHEDYYERGVESNEKLIKLLDAEPKAKAVLADAMENGVPFNVALARHFGPEDLTVEEGDDRYADYKKNIDARNTDLQTRKDSDALYETNMKESDKAVTEFAKEEGDSEEETKAILDKFSDMMQEVFTGKITKATLQAIKRSVKFEKAVQDASDMGELKGKNTKIKAEMEKEVKPKGDGLPTPDRSSEVKDDKAGPVSKIDAIVNGVHERDVYAE